MGWKYGIEYDDLTKGGSKTSKKFWRLCRRPVGAEENEMEKKLGSQVICML